MSKESETYGNDICFPGNTAVSMAGGQQKQMRDIRPGDEVVTVDPVSGKQFTVKVKELTVHEAKNYAITGLLLVTVKENITTTGIDVLMGTKEINATPNHPVLTQSGEKKIGEVRPGDEVLCLDEQTGGYKSYIVWNKQQYGQGKQPVYNIVAESGSTFVINEVMVLQKPGTIKN